MSMLIRIAMFAIIPIASAQAQTFGRPSTEGDIYLKCTIGCEQAWRFCVDLKPKPPFCGDERNDCRARCSTTNQGTGKR
jgi:hypothetical protein